VPDAAQPPLGCSFHPRCPKAFEICGWESRDLHAILEQRWVERGEEVYAAERPLVGDLDKLDIGDDALVPAGPGKDAGDLLAMLEKVKADSVDEPLWKGVREMTAETHGVRVTFYEGTDPPLYETDGARAACLLYKPD
jgi:hypothetical protein